MGSTAETAISKKTNLAVLIGSNKLTTSDGKYYNEGDKGLMLRIQRT